eukprot:TRINITY_DN33_c0_g1_i1.p1 TRINITY_DN33_c0_g1~~TRINITY_DN33_c0_g1_i1.p1  ORF type:complete len:344 (+),score=98.01 TRINITY_DN33_c0_g1_i1:106-1137(+)
MIYRIAALATLVLTGHLAQASIFLYEAGKCTDYTVSNTNCANNNCGQCYNVGSRAGVMCPGYTSTSTGYYCPTDQGPAYACMDWTFGSTAMKAAEEAFNSQYNDSVYFGVGTFGSSADPIRGLGACYRLKIDGMDRDIIAQSINTGGDVSGNQFDLQIGDGGAGAFNNCAGKSFSMFPGSYDGTWGKQYGGVDHRADCSALPQYPQDPTAMKNAGDNLVELCQYSFDKQTRIEGGMNPTILDVSRVKCPEGILELTQLERSDDPNTYQATAANRPAGFGSGGTCQGGGSYCLTRMMDCRKPSGGFKDNLRADLVVTGRKVVQPCTQDGYTRIDVQCGCGDCWC